MNLQRTRGEGCASDLALDRALADELTSAERSALSAHLASCARCRERRALLEVDRQSFDAPPLLRRPPVATSAAAPPAPAPAVISARRPLARAVGAATAILAAAAALVLVLKTPRDGGPDGPRFGGERTKGGEVRLGVYAKRGERVVAVAPGERLLPGDALRFTLRSERPGFVTVLSVDGAGRASVYYPPGSERAAPFDGVGDVALEGSTVLDDTLGDETLYALFCAEPVALEPLRAELERAPRAAPAADGCVHDALAFTKRASP